MRIRWPWSTEAAGASQPAAAARDDDRGWRPIGAGATSAWREFDAGKAAFVRRYAIHLTRSDPLARQIIDIPVDYLTAANPRLRADDDRAQAALDDLWRDPVCDLPKNLPRLVRDHAITGEICLPLYAGHGKARFGYLDPLSIHTVELDPDNAGVTIGVVAGPQQGVGPDRGFRTVLPDAELAPAAQRLREKWRAGYCLYAARNRVIGATRGVPDLLPIAPWLDAYARYMHGEMDRAEFMRAYIWDVTIQGATKDDIDARVAEMGPPEPGTVRVHNEAEAWQPVSPNLDGSSTADVARLFRTHILSGQGLPEHWYGGGGDVNRATAAEMGSPAWKQIAARQREWSNILRALGDFAISVALGRAGPWQLEPAERAAVEWGEIAPPREGAAAAFAAASGAAALARQERLIDAETAARIVRAAAGPLGVDYDAGEALARAIEEGEARDELDAVPDIPGVPPPPDE